MLLVLRVLTLYICFRDGKTDGQGHPGRPSGLKYLPKEDGSSVKNISLMLNKAQPMSKALNLVCASSIQFEIGIPMLSSLDITAC
jgi:hypothetical protein